MYESHAKLLEKLQNDPKPFLEMRAVLTMFGDKWSSLILITLINKSCRFTDMETLLSGISPRTLTRRLRELEAAGLVTKRKFNEFPPRTEYEPTEKALALKPVIHELKSWAKKYYV